MLRIYDEESYSVLNQFLLRIFKEIEVFEEEKIRYTKIFSPLFPLN